MCCHLNDYSCLWCVFIISLMCGNAYWLWKSTLTAVSFHLKTISWHSVLKFMRCSPSSVARFLILCLWSSVLLSLRLDDLFCQHCCRNASIMVKCVITNPLLDTLCDLTFQSTGTQFLNPYIFVLLKVDLLIS